MLTTARRVTGWAFGIAGLLAYNWWLLVPLKPGLMRTPDEFFSNLEVTGQPYATVMQHCDVASGLLLLGAFLLAGRRSLPGGQREWLGLVTFALAGMVGGLFSQVCADGVSRTCFSDEWHFRLPASQYVHDGAGIVEFAAITLALLFALLRTRRVSRGAASGVTSEVSSAAARAYRLLAVGAVIAYPLLAVAYFTNRLGAVVEGLFFAGFTIMVLVQLGERLRRPAESANGTGSPANRNGGVIDRNSAASSRP
jgi:uncharacterized protein DUF998